MRNQINLRKTVAYTIVINAIQITAVIAAAALLLFTDLAVSGPFAVDSLVLVAAGLIVWGAVVDIQQALSARKTHEQAVMLEEAYSQLEALNMTLRAQRHDFLNHLQVVGSLIEMDEHTEAADYIQRVYGDIQSISSALRTASPAVNALIKVKLGESAKRGVLMDAHIHSRWDSLPVQGWEMCRVLGNLIDNAMDAAQGVAAPQVTVTLGEDGKGYCFAVENNGPEVPASLQSRIFLPGFTTKGAGRGMGLAIVHRILTENGGDIQLATGPGKTVFSGRIPRKREETGPQGAWEAGDP